MSSSLLMRLRTKDDEAWRRFVRLYTPLVYHWCRKSGVGEADAADIAQEVFGSVSRAIGKYRHGEQGGTFCGWLRTITMRKLSDLHRRRPPGAVAEGGSDAHAKLCALPEAGMSNSSDDQPANDELMLLRQAIELVLSEFQEETRRAFLRVMVNQQSPADVAKEIGISVNAVYLAKSRVLQRLKQEFSGLIELL